MAFLAIIVATLCISLLATRDTAVAGTVQPQTDVTTIMAADTDVATDATVTTLSATALDGTLAAQDTTANTTSGGTFAVDGNTRTWAAVITIGIGAVFLGLTS